MPLELVDTHCHLDLEPLSLDVAAVLQRAQAAGVQHCITIGTDVPASRANVALAERYPMLRAAVGVHPCDAESVTDAALAAIETLATSLVVVAIGEVGLDYYRNPDSKEAQDRALRGFLAIARRRHLPVLFHCREAYTALLEVLQQEGGVPHGGVIHCASGPPEFIRGAIELGLHISFAGNVTFPKAQALRELVNLVPDERLLIETDAPFLAPQPVRGQSNEPGYVAHTAARIAELRGMSLESLGLLTSQNARQLFKLSGSASSDSHS